ncbi:MAG: phospho-N-acetylmuramoyl-pentapeptide-transferase [Candidatus Omnitrophica bacterium]|nr:phospho-N-acetylmuramoyl-pentapeptide-transferase [Candidatus Omnitrophota bacterium]MDD5236688.1 phospho-N-acetylmuramoyl-pentapeptide-transferase [Candidatus Omnitrophota bacterium]MDD5610026.1 phospho-N-acetylmuramoyl-pentapeptide-transferase [Candidatus Omnitrophota bacterium]
MLYYLLFPFHDILPVFNVIRYITFRAGMAALTAFLLSLLIGPRLIHKLKKMHIGQEVRKEEDSAQLYDLHRKKQGTPTMGGLLILLSIVSANLLWADILNKYLIIACLGTVWLGAVGFYDDYLKIIKKQSKGLSAKNKLAWQMFLGLVLGIIFMLDPNLSTKLDIPFLKDVAINLGYFYILFVILIIAGSSNAVNLTDGLDGLAIGIVIMVAIAYSVLGYVTGNALFSKYLLVPFIPGTAELTVFCASIVGAGLGFLWFNCYPATVFMGDTGSLALGGALGLVAIMIKKELLLVIVGGVLVLEAFSVILQVGSFKLRKKRIFQIAPLHHHFQFLGWSETKVIVRFWIVAALFALFTLVTLKLR